MGKFVSVPLAGALSLIKAASELLSTNVPQALTLGRMRLFALSGVFEIDGTRPANIAMCSVLLRRMRVTNMTLSRFPKLSLHFLETGLGFRFIEHLDLFTGFIFWWRNALSEQDAEDQSQFPGGKLWRTRLQHRSWGMLSPPFVSQVEQPIDVDGAVWLKDLSIKPAIECVPLLIAQPGPALLGRDLC